MKKLFPFLGMLFLSAVFFSCSDDDDKMRGITVTDYALPEDYAWNIPNQRVVHRIDDEETFSQYVAAKKGEVVSGIDFEKYTLLLVQGASSKVVENLKSTLTEGGQYTLNVTVEQNAISARTGWWVVAVVAPKLTNGKPIGLDVKYVLLAHEDYLPASDYVLEKGYEWDVPVSGVLHRIDSKEDFMRYVRSTDCREVIPDIDFERFTLLVTRGKTVMGYWSITKRLRDRGDNYNFNVYFDQSEHKLPATWIVAVVAPKLTTGKDILVDISSCSLCWYALDFTDYSKEGVFWNIVDEDVVYRIDSEEEFLRYVDTGGEKIESDIDFEKNTLLVLRGVMDTEDPRYPSYVVKEVVEYEAFYKMDVTVGLLNSMCLGRQWTVAIVVPKMQKSKIISLNVNLVDSK